MKKQWKQYAPGKTVGILTLHLPEKKPISKLCNKVGRCRRLLKKVPLSAVADTSKHYAVFGDLSANMLPKRLKLRL